VSGLAGQAVVIRLLLDIICSSLMSCLGIAVRARLSMRRTLTRLPACWSPGFQPRRQHRVLAGRLGCSQRQARRYVAQAAGSGRVAIPDEVIYAWRTAPARAVAGTQFSPLASSWRLQESALLERGDPLASCWAGTVVAENLIRAGEAACPQQHSRSSWQQRTTHVPGTHPAG
jgi:hypothetical protein